jgi:two-component system cell cycle sensor histidine kinase PleC
MEHLAQGISVFDRHLNLVLANRRFLELLDLPDRFAEPGTPLEALFRFNAARGEYGDGEADDHVRIRIDLARLFHAHRFERIRPDGTVIEIIGTPMQGGGFVTTYTDTTAVHRSAEALRHANQDLDRTVTERTHELRRSELRYRKSAEFLKATVVHMPQGVCVFDTEMNLVVANDGFFELTQVPKEFNIPGTPFESFMRYNAERGEYGPGDPGELARQRVEMARGMQAHVFERVRPDGTVIEVRGNPIPGLGFISTFIDVTARKRAEADLRRSEAVARAMLDAPGLIVLMIDEKGTILDLNEGAVNGLRSATKAELLGRNVYDFMHPDAASRRRQHAHQALAGGQAVHFEDKSGKQWFETTLTPYGAHQVMIISHDVTHRKLAETRLSEAVQMAEAANRAKTEFLAAMSHELRTPLNAILGFSEIISKQLFGPVGVPRYLEYANDVHASGQHLLSMINDILDISSIEAGAAKLTDDLIDPAATADVCLRLVLVRAEQGKVELCNMVPRDLPVIIADERRVTQILLNLLSNAVKFTLPGGTVSLEAGLSDDSGIVFRVTDTGIGMRSEDIAVALAPFGQVDSGYARRFEGTGLGLPLAKSLTELHGGRLSIESAPGKGTTVAVCFPPHRRAGVVGELMAGDGI